MEIVPQSRNYPERRRWPRFSVELPVLVYCEPSPGIYEGLGKALNGGGMAVNTSVTLRVGDRIMVEFTPPNAEERIKARCSVRNCSSQTYGVEFLTENDADYRVIGQIEYNLNRLAASQQ